MCHKMDINSLVSKLCDVITIHILNTLLNGGNLFCYLEVTATPLANMNVANWLLHESSKIRIASLFFTKPIIHVNINTPQWD